MPILRRYGDKAPQVGDGTFVADTAVLVGDVIVGARSSIWYGAVLRGDVFYIRIGDETSIQDNSVIHVTHGRNATIVGSRVTVGHSVNLHGCTIAERCIVGAGSLVTPGTRIPPGTLALGSPARPKRDLTAEELEWLEVAAEHYV